MATPFVDMIKELSSNLEALRDFVEVVDALLRQDEQNVLKARSLELIPLLLAFNKLYPGKFGEVPTEDYERAFGAKIDVFDDKSKKEGGLTIKIKGPKGSDFQKALREYGKGVNRKSLMLRGALLNLTSAVEWCFSQFVHAYFEQMTEPPGLNDNVFSLADLRRIGSIPDAHKFLIDGKVEKILRESVKEWFVFLKERPKLSMAYLDAHRPFIVELYQRRNVLVHNGGIANQIYQANVEEQFKKNAEIGKALDVDRKYLEDRILRCEISFVLIASEQWKNESPDDVRRAGVLNTMAFEHLKMARYELTEAFSSFVIRDKKMPELDRLVAQLNYWLSMKSTERFDQVKDEVEALDLSGKDDFIRIGWFALTERDKQFFALLPSVLKTKRISRSDLATWPIFKPMREKAACAKYLVAQVAGKKK